MKYKKGRKYLTDKLVKDMTKEEILKLAAKYGIGEAPPDDPIYKTGPTITFISQYGKSTKDSSKKIISKNTDRKKHVQKQQPK